MEFLPGRGRYCEEEEVEMMGDMGSNKLPFSSSSASPSSSQYKGAYGSPRWGDRAAYYNQESLSFSQNIEFNNLRNKNPNEDQGIQGDPPPSGSGTGTGTGDDDHAVCIEREHMFDKVVTPSDVGKLNRLVIPKQHAEKYFPLDSSANEKGLLLSFEDRSGKPWRFRYSYWNSSQSYVMTKGWSRFVKEKKLYAGDIVSFERGAGETGKDRLFIDWRRRSDVQDHHHHHQRGPLPSLPVPYPLSLPGSVPWGRLVYPPTMNYDHSSHLRRTSYDRASASSHYGYNVMNPGSGSVIYLSSPAQEQQYGMVQHSGGRDVPMVYSSVPVVHGKAAAKRLRLFGVNLECPTSEEDAECDIPTPIPNPTMGSNSFYPQLPQLPPPPLQLRLYNSAPPPRTQSGSPPNMKSSMSLDLDI